MMFFSIKKNSYSVSLPLLCSYLTNLENATETLHTGISVSMPFLCCYLTNLEKTSETLHTGISGTLTNRKKNVWVLVNTPFFLKNIFFLI